MRYVETGSTVIYNGEEVKVIDKCSENEISYWVLETSIGLRSVPATKIMWNGKSNFVTADGYVVSNLIAETEKVISGVKEKMKIWDSENPQPDGFHREKAIDGCFMEWLRNDAADYDNESLGFIVKKLIVGLQEI